MLPNPTRRSSRSASSVAGSPQSGFSPEGQPGLHVLHAIERGQHAHELECPGEAQPGDLVGRQPVDGLSRQPDGAGIRLQGAGEEIERRRLARTVRSDQADDLGFADRHRQSVHGHEAAEPAGQAFDLEERSGHAGLRVCSRSGFSFVRSKSPAMPLGTP